MAFAQRYDRAPFFRIVRYTDRLIPAFIGIGVIFACLGLGEAVYRCLFLEFDGATDRLPLELLFGFMFAWAAMKLIGKVQQSRAAKVNLIRHRSHKIRQALEAISPSHYPTNHQAIRVIREEADRIDGALNEIISA